MKITSSAKQFWAGHLKLRNKDDRSNIIKRSPTSRKALGPFASVLHSWQNPDLIYMLSIYIYIQGKRFQNATKNKSLQWFISFRDHAQESFQSHINSSFWDVSFWVKLKYSVWSVNSILKQAQWKFLQQSICDVMQINTVSVLESTTYSMSWSRLQASRADVSAQELTELRAAEPGLLFLRSRPSSVGEQHSLAFPSPFPGCLIGRRQVHQLEPFQICPSLSPNTRPICPFLFETETS